MLNLSALNPQQRLAVQTVEGPVLILAGAGTGKTRVITYRIAHLIERGISPENVLAVTFTNKAAREMRERVMKLLPAKRKSNSFGRRASDRSARPSPTVSQNEFGADAEGSQPEANDPLSAPVRPTICTFHSLCVRILRQHIDRLGYKRNFVIYNESEQLAAVKKVLGHISANGEKTDPKLILSLLSRYKNGGADGRSLQDESAAAMAEHIRQRYDSTLRACNAVDFDDLLLLALRLFEEHPETLDACRSHYRFVMVDEYQDTNAAQFRLVHLLTNEHRNLCVVGDDDQSIYGWRGAEIANLLDLEKFFPEVKIVKLEQNYRSTNTILTAANAVIKHNPRRRPKQLWSDKGQGAKIRLRTFADDAEEARGTAEQIEYARKIQRVPWSAQAILFRTNIQSRPLETALRQAGIAYHLIGAQSFFDRREIKDFVAYLKLFLNPHDDVSLLRVANVPARGLSDTTLQRLLSASHERKCSVYGAMLNPSVQITLSTTTRDRLQEFVALVEHTHAWLRTGAGDSLAQWAERFLAEIGYIDELRRSEKTPEAFENRLRSLKDFIGTLDQTGAASEPPHDRILAFLEDLTLDEDRAEEKERVGEAVTLITVHSCKGLEFPHVSIVGLEDGLLPHSRSKVEGSLDEERRLFYVAMTRAMQSLTISHCLTRKKFGEVVQCHPSPFLQELPEHLVESDDDTPSKAVNRETGKSFFDSLRANL